MADGDAASGNQRDGLRLRLRIAGRLVPADGSASRNVDIRDISATGARVDVGGWRDLPHRFFLLVRAAPGEAPHRLSCELRWLAGPVAGVRFCHEVPADVLQALTGFKGQIVRKGTGHEGADRKR
mgnify:CR=1 FL=1